MDKTNTTEGIKCIWFEAYLLWDNGQFPKWHNLDTWSKSRCRVRYRLDLKIGF